MPDHSTIWRFRQELAAHGLAEALFEEINRQLDARGLIVRQGTLIDATLLQAAVKPPSVKEGTVSERDPAAGWTKKNGKSHFGYKAHVAAIAMVGARMDSERPTASKRPSFLASAVMVLLYAAIIRVRRACHGRSRSVTAARMAIRHETPTRLDRIIIGRN